VDLDSSNNTITLYHGSANEVRKPIFGFGNRGNDYGLGFYTTQDYAIAGEWAVRSPEDVDGRDGFINEYRFDLNNLTMLDLTQQDIDKWIAILMVHRTGRYSAAQKRVLDEFVEHRYMGDESHYDVVKGWRANDSYFRFALDYALRLISQDELKQAVALGNLGEQIVLMSHKAFDNIEFIGSHSALAGEYYLSALKRDANARKAYEDIISGRKA
jgi:hypothetical protein